MYLKYSALISIFLLISTCKQGLSQNSIGFHGASIYIAPEEVLGIYCDILVEPLTKINNEGAIKISSEDEPTNIMNYSSDTIISGNGNILLNSINDIYISGNDWNFGNLTIDGPNDVSLETNINITDKLELKKGKIIGNGNLISLLGGTSGLVVNNTEDNSSYIVGSLRYYCSQGENILFPVGNSDEYHPIEISNNYSNVKWIEMDYSSTDISYFDNDLQLIGDIWWQFTIDNPESEGYIYATAYTYNFDLTLLAPDAYIALVHIAGSDGQDDIPYFIDDALLGSNIDNTKITSDQISKPGYLNLADISVNRVVIPNYIILEKNIDNNFRISNIERMDNPKIVIYTQWGNIIYESALYQNDFDFSGYPKGTYYYKLTYKINGKEKYYQSFIEII